MRSRIKHHVAPREKKAKIFPKNIQKYKFPIFLVVFHIPLGLLFYQYNLLAFLHPLVVFFLGLFYAIRKNENMEKVAWVAAYIVGSEVLWRMADSPIYWEFGKYSVAAIMIVALVQRKHQKIPTFPLLYLIFLIPASLLTLSLGSLGDAKDKLSFNMSGPFLLFICCYFFSHLKINSTQIKKILIYLTLPLISIGVTSLFYTVTIENIEFSNESNSLTSGGYGPNQVSSVLGLGVFICVAVYLLFKNKFKDKIFLSLMTLLFAAQSVLTFSRGGMYNAVGGILIIVILLMRNTTQGLKKLIPVAGIAIIFLLLIFPFINDFTGGNLQSRFEDTEATGRFEIIEADLQIFQENPILGAGVGQAKDLRKEYFGKSVGAHTEYTRIISEHGLFGILAILALGFGFVVSFRNQRLTIGKALAAGAVLWSCLFMLNAGMRLAAPSFMWGLCYLIVAPLQRRKTQKLSKFRAKEKVYNWQ